TLRLTGLARDSHLNSFSPAYPSGLFTFGNAITGAPGVVNTGNGFAQFLLGLVSRAEEGLVLQPSYFIRNYFDLTASDEYRMPTVLTVNLRLGTEATTPQIEKYDRQSTLSLEHINPENDKPGALIFAGSDGVGRSLQPVTVRWEPSVGIAVNPWNDRNTL